MNVFCEAWQQGEQAWRDGVVPERLYGTAQAAAWRYAHSLHYVSQRGYAFAVATFADVFWSAYIALAMAEREDADMHSRLRVVDVARPF
jgi:hypothetical protein